MKTMLFIPVLVACLLCVMPYQAKADAVPVAIPTAATTSTLYPIGAALGNLWNRHVPGIHASVQSSNGGVQNIRLLSRGEAQVSFAVTSIVWQAMKGQGGFRGHSCPGMRVLAGLYYNPNHIVASGKSGVRSLSDFRGKTFVPGLAGGTTIGEAVAHWKAAHLEYPGDMKLQYVGPAEAADLMRNRFADGVWIMAGLPNAGVTEMCATAGAHLVPVGDDVLEELKREHPWYARFVIPAGTYPGQDGDVVTSAVKMVLIADASLPDDLAYAMVKCFWENLDAVRTSHAVMRGVNVKDAVTDLAGIPLHDGAARYYREIGLLGSGDRQ